VTVATTLKLARFQRTPPETTVRLEDCPPTSRKAFLEISL